MEYIYGAVIGLVVGILIGRAMGGNKEDVSSKQQSLNQIMNLATTKGRITNDDVEGMLKVSDSTAYRYLEELEKQGKLKQIGKTGRSVTYIAL